MEAFAPELLLTTSALEDASVLAFLQQNYVGHFDDIDCLASAAESLSDAAALLQV